MRMAAPGVGRHPPSIEASNDEYWDNEASTGPISSQRTDRSRHRGEVDIHPILTTAVTTNRKTVRGGSRLDRPRRARSAFRLHYEASQAVHDVGFRVVCEVDSPEATD